MKKFWVVLFSFFIFCGFPGLAFADEQEDITHDVSIEWYIGDWAGNENLLNSRELSDVPNGDFNYKDYVWNPDGATFYREYGIYPIIRVNGRYYLLTFMDVRSNFPMDNDNYIISFSNTPNHIHDDVNAYIGLHYTEVKFASNPKKDKIKVSIDGSANDNLIEPTTYEVYQIFDVRKSADVEEDVTTDETVGKTIGGEDTGFAYYISTDSEWYDVISELTQYFTLSPTTEERLYNVTLADGLIPQESTAIEIAAELEKYIDGKTSTTLVANEANMNMNPGYYLIVSPINSNLILATTNIDITEKAQYPTITKEIAEEDINSGIGETIHYTSTVSFPRGSKASAVLTDVMDEALTFEEIVDISPSIEYNLEKTNNGFIITIEADVIKAMCAEGATDLVINYTAVVNKKAVPHEEINNEITLTYVNYTQSDNAITSVTSMQILKYAADDDDKNPLPGADFQILDENNNPVNLYENKPNEEYRLAAAGDATNMNTFRTSTKLITINGLDADVSYKLKEIKAPNGYNLIQEAIDIELDAQNTIVVEIANNQGSELPSTGGIGVIILYMIGGILIAISVIVFSIRKIRSRNDE